MTQKATVTFVDKHEPRPFSLSALSQNQHHSECHSTVIEDRSATELAEHDMRVFEEIRMEESKETKGGSASQPSHLQMLKNLEDVFNFI